MILFHQQLKRIGAGRILSRSEGMPAEKEGASVLYFDKLHGQAEGYGVNFFTATSFLHRELAAKDLAQVFGRLEPYFKLLEYLATIVV